MLESEEIRAGLGRIREAATDPLQNRELFKRVEEARRLLDTAESHGAEFREPFSERSGGLGRRIWDEIRWRPRQLWKPSKSLCHPNIRWEAVSVLVALLLTALVVVAYLSNVSEYQQLRNVSDFLQSADGLIAVVVVIAVWSYSTWRFERDRRVARAVAAIDRCRALILIVDAHAMSKDFSRHWDPRRAKQDKIVDELPRDEAIEYLAIAAQIAKLTAQIAALYGRYIHHESVIAAIDSVTQLALAIERNALAKQDLIARSIAAARAS
jgi:hypothetical protein